MGNRIPLARLFTESIAVILSILAAFAIDAWWDGRQAEDLERELLVSLERGFEENVRVAEAVSQEARRQQALIGRFMTMSPDDAEDISPDSTYIFLRALWRPNYVQLNPNAPLYGGGLNTAALVATLGAGQLSLLSDKRLLTALADWQGVAVDLAQRSDEVVETERQVMEALARYPEIQSVWAGFDARGEIQAFSDRAPRLPGLLARRVRADNDLMARVARKGFASRAQQDFLDNLRVRADSVLALIRADLAR
jgi:hypothetical protein